MFQMLSGCKQVLQIFLECASRTGIVLVCISLGDEEIMYVPMYACMCVHMYVCIYPASAMHKIEITASSHCTKMRSKFPTQWCCHIASFASLFFEWKMHKAKCENQIIYTTLC